MRHEYKGEYHDEWDLISTAYKADANWRCVRCFHPFESENGRPLLCDLYCDTTRGVHRHDGSDGLPSGRIISRGDDRFRGLNYGVHHFDGDKSNNRWWNLLPLCNSCHLTIQSRVIPERPWLFEHSEWAKIYVAGFYAWWFARLEPRREEVEAHIDLYLALGQPWLYPDLVQTSEYFSLRNNRQMIATLEVEKGEWIPALGRMVKPSDMVTEEDRQRILAYRPDGP
jgi:hypothetical protein